MWMQSHTKWRGIKRSEYPKVVVLLILQYIDPVDTYLNPSLKSFVTNMSEAKEFYFSEFNRHFDC